jgi:hypothetical protein
MGCPDSPSATTPFREAADVDVINPHNKQIKNNFVKTLIAYLLLKSKLVSKVFNNYLSKFNIFIFFIKLSFTPPFETKISEIADL